MNNSGAETLRREEKRDSEMVNCKEDCDQTVLQDDILRHYPLHLTLPLPSLVFPLCLCVSMG